MFPGIPGFTPRVRKSDLSTWEAGMFADMRSSGLRSQQPPSSTPANSAETHNGHKKAEKPRNCAKKAKPKDNLMFHCMDDMAPKAEITQEKYPDSFTQCLGHPCNNPLKWVTTGGSSYIWNPQI